MPKISDESVVQDLLVVQGCRIYFGHQSVGEDILTGVRRILDENPEVHINRIRLNDSLPIPVLYLADSFIGENRRTDLKCRDFLAAVDSFASRNLDIAMMKFCFADIQRDTNIGQIFAEYERTIDTLRRRHPSIRIVHVTVPLSSGTRGWKRLINRILGRVGNNDMANVQRCRLNEMLRERYAGEPIFDLAALESTHADGTRVCFTFEGREYYAMAEDYASADGDHLNLAGQSAAARLFLHTLAQAMQ